MQEKGKSIASKGILEGLSISEKENKPEKVKVSKNDESVMKMIEILVNLEDDGGSTSRTYVIKNKTLRYLNALKLLKPSCDLSEFVNEAIKLYFDTEMKIKSNN